MRKRSTIWVLAACASLAAVIAMLAIPTEREPEYDGRKLREWIVAQLWELAEGLPIKKVRLSELDGFDEVRWFGGPLHTQPTCRAIAEQRTFNGPEKQRPGKR